MHRWILRKYVGEGNSFFLHTAGLGDHTATFPPHTHDHLEIIWGDRGSGTHLLNGEQRPFRRGSVVFVRPEDAHALRCKRPRQLRMGHLAFPVEAMAKLEERYPGQWPNPFAFETPEAREFHLRGNQWMHFRWVVRELRAGDRTPAALDWFLLSVAQLIRPMVRQQQPHRWPDWLDRLHEKLDDPEVLRGGTQKLCDLADCSPQHLVRAVRKHIGVTPTDLLNEARLHYAAKRLMQTDDGIFDIATDCGLHNLGHFYKLFHQKYGTTPRRYRIRHHEDDVEKN